MEKTKLMDSKREKDQERVRSSDPREISEKEEGGGRAGDRDQLHTQGTRTASSSTRSRLCPGCPWCVRGLAGSWGD